jgi:predicted nucleic acid-binding protein
VRATETYALDTNIYISALRNAARMERVKRFRLRAASRMRLSAVVALELRAGARTEAQREALQEFTAQYAERGQVLVPSFDAYEHAGRVLAALGATAPSLVNDALLAASCRESGTTLVTENARDFAAIQRHLRGFRFVESAALI